MMTCDLLVRGLGSYNHLGCVEAHTSVSLLLNQGGNTRSSLKGVWYETEGAIRRSKLFRLGNWVKRDAILYRLMIRT